MKALVSFAFILAVCALFLTYQQKQAKSDYEELTNLVLWERQAKVRKLNDELADCYWSDATVTTSWTSGSAADYLKAGNSQNNRAEASSDEVILNHSSAPIIHQKGNRAYAELPTTGKHWIKVNGVEAIWTSYMRLIYRLEKRDGVWKIADMTSVFEKDTLEPVIAGTDLHINPQDLEGLRPSYKWLAYTRLKASGNVSDNMLGTDRPEDIAEIYNSAEKWLKGE